MKKLLSFSLNKQSEEPLAHQLERNLRAAIIAGQIEPGQKLPGIRSIAEELDISVATVRLALDGLTAHGLVTAKHGTGNYVSEEAPQRLAGLTTDKSSATNTTVIAAARLDGVSDGSKVPPSTLSARAQLIDRLFDAEDFHSRYDDSVEIDFRPGAPPLIDTADNKHWQRVLAQWCREAPFTALKSCEPGGLPSLRESLAIWLRQTRGVICDQENIVIVNGAQQARHLLARLLIDKGTTIAFEDPGSIFAKLSFTSQGAALKAIPVDDSGLPTSELDAIECKLIYVSPSAQFPTGAMLTPHRRRQVARWARKTGALIMEDDNNCEFQYDCRPSPSIQSMAPESTIYLGSFSQNLAPSLRLGYLVVPNSLREPVSRMKWLADRYSSPIIQHLLDTLIRSGFLEKHLLRSRAVSEYKRKVLLNELQDPLAEIFRFIPVKGGLHQTVWLHSTVDDTRLAARCFQKGVGVVPVSPCFIERSRPGLMLNFSSLSDAQIRNGIKIICTTAGEIYDG